MSVKRIHFVVISLASLFSVSLFWIVASQSSSLIVIEGATLIDGTGGAPIVDSVVVIEKDRILKVFRRGEQDYPVGARVISVQGKTIIPALFDIDTHIAQQGLEAAAQALTNYLYYGVLNISDTGVSLIHGSGLKKLAREGKFISPRLFEAGPTLTAVGGHPIPVNRALGRTIDTRTLTQVKDPEDAVRQVQKYVKEFKVATIKTILESGGDLGYPRMTLETYTTLVDEAHRQGMKVYTHASRLSDVRDALKGGVDLLAHGFSEELTSESDVARMIVRRNASWLPDLNNVESTAKLFDNPEIWSDPDVLKSVPSVYRNMIKDPAVRTRLMSRLENSRHSYEIRLRTVKVLYDMGVNILVGTDSTGAPHRMFYGFDIHRELEHLVRAGMKPMDVIVAASRKAAEYLGKESDLGTVEVGKIADLLILTNNPLEDISNSRSIEQVVYAGSFIDRDNLPMLDPFKKGLLSTGKEEQIITNQQVAVEEAAEFPLDQGRELVLAQCSACHSLQVVLKQRLEEAEWEVVVLGMMEPGSQDIDEIVSYLSKHFGR
ncbi:MAG: amidohydrolase family protein [Acidobacteriota bacterium]|nr:amidohydrolase family protein [Acidobacteriota bacterium]